MLYSSCRLTKGVKELSLKETGVQTDLHPVPGLKGESGSSNMSYFEKRMVYLVRIFCYFLSLLVAGYVSFR